MKPISVTLQLAEHVLTRLWQTSVALSAMDELDSRNRVLRCLVSGGPFGAPATVIVKHLIDDSATAWARFRNECAGLAFLNSISSLKGAVPQLIGGDSRVGLLISADLGDYPSAQNVLFHATEEETARLLLQLGALIGRVQVATYGQEARFRQEQIHFGAHSPTSDAGRDLRTATDALDDILRRLGVRAGSAFWLEVTDIASTIHDPGPFRAFCHGDIAPHNALVADDRLIMVDVEYGRWQHALTDIAGLRLAFPTAYHGRRTPLSLIRQVERVYRQTLAAVIPEIADEARYRRDLARACAHWPLSRMVGFEADFIAYFLLSEDIAPDEAPRVDLYRTALYTYLMSGLATLNDLDQLPATRAVFRALLDRYAQYQPTTHQRDYYPGFALKLRDRAIGSPPSAKVIYTN